MSSLSRSRASLHFNPRTPRGVRPVPSPTGWASLKFQSTHPARGATPHVGQRPVQQAISIHAPREGCDRLYLMALFGTYNNFNPRTPRGVRRPAAWFKIGTGPFQSTHPARGATCKLGGGRKMTPNISIHAPREGCDGQRVCIWGYPKDFNPRTPRGVRPSASRPAIIPFSISIHAPREGCDESACGCSRPGGRFQSTHPARGATDFRLASDRAVYISIHAPREGCDVAFVSP